MNAINKIFFISIFLMLDVKSIHAWQWWWNKYKWQPTTEQSWKKYGTQKVITAFQAIKNNQKKAIAITIGIGGLVIANRYKPQIHSFYTAIKNLTIKKLSQEKILEMTDQYWDLKEKGDLENAKHLEEQLVKQLRAYEKILHHTDQTKKTYSTLLSWRQSQLNRKSNENDNMSEREKLELSGIEKHVKEELYRRSALDQEKITQTINLYWQEVKNPNVKGIKERLIEQLKIYSYLIDNNIDTSQKAAETYGMLKKFMNDIMHDIKIS